jgi:RNA-directed DNA polymerase
MNERGQEERPAIVPEMDKLAGEDLWQRHKAQPEIWSERMLLALETGNKGNKWHSLIDKVYAERTLGMAWEKVQANAGACGVDGITIERFAKESQQGLLALREQLQAGIYQPKAVKRVWIPKPGSTEKRPLGIPAVRDRVVQAATRMVIEPIFERQFAPQSYGFRPGRSCQEALRRVDELLKSGYNQIVDIDIKGYFDAIPHKALMAKVRESIVDGRVLELIEGFLKAGVMQEGEIHQAEDGTPQGGVISPLLANIYLNELDWQMKSQGIEMVRYADDMVVLCRETEAAQQALAKIKIWMEAAELELHPEKTRIVDMGQQGSHFDFLGYRFWRRRDGRIRRYIRPKSRQKLKERIRSMTKRNNAHSMETIIQRVNQILVGWYGYFKHASGEALEETDGWIRGRLRAILRKRRKSKGCATGYDHQLYKNCYFTELGLFCLKTARELEINSLRNGAKC